MFFCESVKDGSEVEKELKNINVLELTPMDAINILYKLKDKIGK